MDKLKKVVFGLIVVILLAQFYTPERNLGDSNLESFFTETNAPVTLQTVIKTSCTDCHSNHTKYPWYNNITPLNIWLKNHVDEGKSHLNFSMWKDYSLKKKAHKMEEIMEEVKEGEMPLNSYTWIHKDAVLNSKRLNALITWAKENKMKYELKGGFEDHD
jgi:hypothetical protein